MTKQTNPISVPKLCELYGKDPSQMRKMIDKLGIKKTTVRRKSDNRTVTIISDKDHQLLVNTYPNLTASKASKRDISLKDATKRLGYKDDQISNLHRACKSWDIEVYEKKFNGRTQKCISSKNFKKMEKLRTLTVVDVE